MESCQEQGPQKTRIRANKHNFTERTEKMVVGATCKEECTQIKTSRTELKHTREAAAEKVRQPSLTLEHNQVAKPSHDTAGPEEKLHFNPAVWRKKRVREEGMAERKSLNRAVWNIHVLLSWGVHSLRQLRAVTSLSHYEKRNNYIQENS